jgi:hypothetical protein
MMDFSKPNAAQYESAHMQSLSSPTNIETRVLKEESKSKPRNRPQVVIVGTN